MALQGLRGAGFNPVSGAPYQKMRDDREQKAVDILEKRQEREDRKKERQKENKEADRQLQEEFDKAKTEAVLLGLPKGKAQSMSLGALKGWVSANRELKVQNEKMQALLLKRDENKRKNKEAKAAETKQANLDAGAAAALKTPLGQKGGFKPQNLDQQMGYNQAREAQRKGMPPTMRQVPIQGSDQMATQTYGGGMPLKTTMPPQMPVPFKHEGKTIAHITQHGNMMPLPSAKTDDSSSYFTEEQIARTEAEYQRVAKEYDAGPPDTIKNPLEKQMWSERKAKYMQSLEDRLRDMTRGRRKQSPGQPQASMPQKPTGKPQTPQDFAQHYFTPDGKVTQNFIKEIEGVKNGVEGGEKKKQIIFQAVRNGVIDAQSARQILMSPPFPLTPNE